MDKETIDNLKETQFNSNIASLQRLGEALQLCNYLSSACKHNGLHIDTLKGYRSQLMNAFKEIYPKCNVQEVNKIKMILKKFKFVGPLNNMAGEPTNRIITVNRRNFNTYFNVCFNLELELRMLATKKGMLITDKRSIGDEL